MARQPSKGGGSSNDDVEMAAMGVSRSEPQPVPAPFVAPPGQYVAQPISGSGHGDAVTGSVSVVGIPVGLVGQIHVDPLHARPEDVVAATKVNKLTKYLCLIMTVDLVWTVVCNLAMYSIEGGNNNRTIALFIFAAIAQWIIVLCVPWCGVNAWEQKDSAMMCCFCGWAWCFMAYGILVLLSCVMTLINSSSGDTQADLERRGIIDWYVVYYIGVICIYTPCILFSGTSGYFGNKLYHSLEIDNNVQRASLGPVGIAPPVTVQPQPPPPHQQGGGFYYAQPQVQAQPTPAPPPPPPPPAFSDGGGGKR